MKKKPSPAEWQILLALWQLDKRASLDEIIRELDETPTPSDGKIRTLLNRAIEKGFVRTALKASRSKGPQPRGRPPTRYYWAAKTREAATRDEVQRFVSVYLGNDKDAVALLKEIVTEKPKRGRKRGGKG